jgi:D-sedoheptulose 7-phosphate isomerase
MKSYGILGFTGGTALGLCDVPIHFPINDMQISEDMQLIVGHMVMQYLYTQRDQISA